MKINQNKFSAFLLFLSIGLMMLPALEGKLHVFKECTLHGDIIAKDTTFSAGIWFDGDYAKQKEKYLNDNFGFRNGCVRLRNQISYSLFGRVFANGIIEGKSGYFFVVNYLKAYSGMDYAGDSLISERFRKLKSIQDTLASKGILFILVFAPGPASFNPEYIPEPYHSSPVTNYFTSVEAAKKMGLNFIDFNAWFMKMKKHTAFPLYSNLSTHSSTYGVYMEFDSISSYIEQKLHKKLARYDYSKVYWTDSLMNDDDELEQDFNLIQKLPHSKMAYPIIKWIDTSNCYRPRLLGIGDSYFNQFYSLNLLKEVYKLPRFWGYYQRLYDYKPLNSHVDIGDMDLKSYVERQNVVILMATEMNYGNFGWNFVDELYNAYQEGSYVYNKDIQSHKLDYERRKINYNIMHDPERLDMIKREAKSSNISIDSEIQLNIMYEYKQEEKNWYQSTSFKVQDIAYDIRNDSAWFKGLKKQALQRHLNLDSFLITNAQYIYYTQHRHDPDSTREWEIENMRNYIYTDQNWLHTIENQSADLDIGLDSCVKLNAIYMVDHKDKK